LLLKDWECVLVGHHDNVGKVIEDWEKRVGTCIPILALETRQQPWARITICYFKKENKTKMLSKKGD